MSYVVSICRHNQINEPRKRNKEISYPEDTQSIRLAWRHVYRIGPGALCQGRFRFQAGRTHANATVRSRLESAFLLPCADPLMSIFDAIHQGL